MRAGLLRKRLVFERPTETLVAGEAVKTYATLFEAWGEIRPLSGRELFQSNMTQAELSHRISVRYQAGKVPKTSDRVRYGDRAFDITAVMNVDERNRELVVMAVERGV